MMAAIAVVAMCPETRVSAVAFDASTMFDGRESGLVAATRSRSEVAAEPCGECRLEVKKLNGPSSPPAPGTVSISVVWGAGSTSAVCTPLEDLCEEHPCTIGSGTKVKVQFNAGAPNVYLPSGAHWLGFGSGDGHSWYPAPGSVDCGTSVDLTFYSAQTESPANVSFVVIVLCNDQYCQGG